MNVSLVILLIFAVLLALSVVGVLPVSWIGVLVAYLATDHAVGVIRSSR